MIDVVGVILSSKDSNSGLKTDLAKVFFDFFIHFGFK